MSLQRVSAQVDGTRVAEILRADGGVIVEDLVDESMVDEAMAQMQPYIDANGGGPDEFTGLVTRRTGALVARSETCRSFVQHPLALATSTALLGEKCQLHLTQLISIGAQETIQPLHRDQWAFDFFPFPADWHVQCNTLWAMTDFTEANGATRVALGSQDDPNDLGRSHEGTVPAEMSKGSVLFYTGKVYHSGGANRTDQTRVGMNITYCQTWVRQEENQYLSCPQDVAAELPEDLLRLMGYDRGAYALGYIDDLRDPLEAIRPTGSATGFAAAALDAGNLADAQARMADPR
jgi:ectoine hydroxylase-related dioxygenase (phytanoyl-CoA dioxygenase family)